jgi:type I restriction enzyme, S subunit
MMDVIVSNSVLGKRLPKGWSVQPIDSLCTRVTSGGTPSRKVNAYYENGSILWIKSSELKDWYVHDSSEKITGDALGSSSAKLLPKDTVLLALYGDGRTITSLGILAKEAACNQACCAMICDTRKSHPHFLLYSLKCHRHELIGLASGASQRNLSGKLLRQFPIAVPPLPTQRKIAGVLSAYDDLIENNTRQIAILEEMAQAIYREWFVHFRFPGHEKVKFFDSPLGSIPEGWEVNELTAIGFVGRGRSRHRPRNEPSLYGGPYPFFQTGDIKGANTHLWAHTQTYSDLGLAQSKLWDAGTLCITIAANIAETAILARKGCFPDSVVGFIADPEKVDVVYVKMFLDSIKQSMQNASRGTTQDNLSVEKLLTFQIPTPPLVQIKAFRDAVTPLLQKSLALFKKSEVLRRTRDLLLHKLISGQLDVEELDIDAGEPSANDMT